MYGKNKVVVVVVLACGLVSHTRLAFFCNTLNVTLQRYFICTQFSRFDCNTYMYCN